MSEKIRGEYWLDRLSRDENGWMDAIPREVGDSNIYGNFIPVIEKTPMIEAAKDMHQALEIAIETFNQVDTDLLPSSTNKEIDDTLKTIERVLMKARGEQPNKEGES